MTELIRSLGVDRSLEVSQKLLHRSEETHGVLRQFDRRQVLQHWLLGSLRWHRESYGSVTRYSGQAELVARMLCGSCGRVRSASPTRCKWSIGRVARLLCGADDVESHVGSLSRRGLQSARSVGRLWGGKVVRNRSRSCGFCRPRFQEGSDWEANLESRVAAVGG